MGYITILDFRAGKVFIRQYPENDERDAEEMAQDFVGHNDINYICTNELELDINTEII